MPDVTIETMGDRECEKHRQICDLRHGADDSEDDTDDGGN